MAGFLLLGWAFVIFAFVAAAAEIVARIHGGPAGAYVSAYDIWYTVWPGNLVITQTMVERHLGVALWDYVARPILSLPAWLLFGAPGGALIWFHGLRRSEVDIIGEESFSVYDTLVEAARKEEGYDPNEDDMAPDHGPVDGYDVEIDDRPMRNGIDQYDPGEMWTPDADDEGGKGGR